MRFGEIMERIAVIGAGPAGMAASLSAVSPEYKIFLFDSNEQPGRKLAVTGSGRGNLSNRGVSSEKYHSDSKDFIKLVLDRIGYEELIQWLLSQGIPTYATADGWCYPVSNSAANVAGILSAQLKQKDVQFLNKHKVKNIQIIKSGFQLFFEDNQTPMEFSQVIVACGGKAHPLSGSCGDLFQILEDLGYSIAPIFPALAPIHTETKTLHWLKGVRLNLKVELFLQTHLIGQTRGNAIFTERGLNGPAVMDLSHLVPQKIKENECYLSVNFLDEYQDVLESLLSRFLGSDLPVITVLSSVLPMKVARTSLHALGFPEDVPLSTLRKVDTTRLIEWLTSFRLIVKGAGGFEDCQSSTGGIRLCDIDPETMQSRLHPGLFFAGEVLNVVGPCGGYNLHWAFSSGVLAGKAAGKNQ